MRGSALALWAEPPERLRRSRSAFRDSYDKTLMTRERPWKLTITMDRSGALEGSRRDRHTSSPGLFPSSFERIETLPPRCRAACHVGDDGVDHVAEVIEQTLGIRLSRIPAFALEHAGHGFLPGVLSERDAARLLACAVQGFSAMLGSLRSTSRGSRGEPSPETMACAG